MLLALISPAYSSGSKVRGFLLQLLPSGDVIQAGSIATWKVASPVIVVVRMVNDSDRTVHYSLTSPARDYEIQLLDASGRAVRERDELRKMKESSSQRVWVESRNMLGDLKPGESADDAITVSNLYDLSSPGEYSLRVERKFPDVGKHRVRSERLVFRITH
jgi:hypothetical protein